MRLLCSTHLSGPPGASLLCGSLIWGSTRLRGELGEAEEQGASRRLRLGSADRGSAIVPFLTPGALGLAQGCRRGHPGPATASRCRLPGLSCAFPAAALRRAARRDAGVRQTWGSRDFGRREHVEPGEGPRSPSTPASVQEGGYPPEPTFPIAAGLGRFVFIRGLVSAICRVHLSTPGSRSSLRLDLAPAFVEWRAGAGSEQREATRGHREPRVKRRSHK